MSKTSYAERISKAQVMLAGLKNNAEQLERRGLDQTFIGKLETDRNAALEMNNEQEKLKSDLITKTTELESKLTEIEKLVSEAQKIVKLDLDKTRWKEFGIEATR